MLHCSETGCKSKPALSRSKCDKRVSNGLVSCSGDLQGGWRAGRNTGDGSIPFLTIIRLSDAMVVTRLCTL